MDFQTPEHWDSIRAGVREVCERYGGEYWRRLDRERGSRWSSWRSSAARGGCRR